MISDIHFFFNSSRLHFTQLISGLEILNRTGKINLSYSLEFKSYPVDFCRISYKSKILIFDLADSSGIREDFYNECDFYIKRMLLKEDLQNKRRLIPFGLNYCVFLENQWMKNLKFNKKYFTYSLRYHSKIARILNMKNSISTSHLDNIQDRPTDKFKMIFRTRLWNPDNNAIPWKKEERRQMNRDRIEINKVLKEQFPDSFNGGIERDPFSEKVCPELLLPNNEYHKANYLKTLKEASVGIITEGLEKSIGWKFGEYVAHSLAVITPPIDEFQFLGDFKEGVNYVVYSNQQELITQINNLLNDPDLRMNIQRCNHDYYQQYLEPSAKLEKIFELVDKSID